MDYPAKINAKVRNLIMDYALGAAIITLLPVPQLGWLKAIALIVLIFFLIRGIARLWGFQKGGDFLARVGILFGITGAILTGLLVWLCLFMVAVLARIPRLMVLAPGAVAFCCFWGIGQTVHHFYLSKTPKASDHSHSTAGQTDEP